MCQGSQSPQPHLEDGSVYRPPSETRTPRKDRCAKDHNAPSHISKMVPPTIHLGPPNLTIDRTVFEMWLSLSSSTNRCATSKALGHRKGNTVKGGGGIVYHRHDEEELNWEPGEVRLGAGVRSS